MQYSIKDSEVISKGNWPTTKAAALKESIRKYKWLVAWHEAHPKAPAQISDGDSCALCELYYDESLEGCEGCPVSKHTGLIRCHETPWQMYNGERDPILARAYAQSEVIFLEGLQEK